jgi:uncharacterized protein YfkK (UPF0435 family)
MSELDDLPEATHENLTTLYDMVKERSDIPANSLAEAYRMWLEAQLDADELEE